MQSKIERPSKTEVRLAVTVDSADLALVKTEVYNELRKKVTAPGFRPGKAPDNIVDKELGVERIQAEVIDHTADKFFRQLVAKEKLRPMEAPRVEVIKFVPYSQLELKYEFETFPAVKLADYKAIKKTKPEVKLEDKEVDSVIESLRLRAGKRSKVDRAAVKGDEVMVDFKGMRDGVAVPGAESTNYPVMLGSGRFVPGFEEALIGAKAGDNKEFEVTFPKDYAEPTLQGKKVKFSAKVHEVSAVELPKIDEEFAKGAGPFKSIDELRQDITKQLTMEKSQDAERLLTDEIVLEVVDKSQLDLPQRLVNKQMESLWSEFEANVRTQNQSLENYLKQAKKSRADIEQLLQKQAEQRVKTALVLSEVAKAEKIEVTPEEVEIRLQILKGRYQDPQMLAELEHDHARADVADQLTIEKTVARLVEMATK